MCAERHTSVSDSPFVLPALLLCGFLCFSHECLCLGPHFFLFFCFHCFPFPLFTLTDTFGTISPLKPSRSRSLPGKQSTTTILLRASFAQSAHASHLLGSFFLLLARLRSNFRCTSFRSTPSSSNSLKLIKCNYVSLSLVSDSRLDAFPVGRSSLPSLVSSAQFRLLVCFLEQGSGAGAGAGAGSCASSPVAI